MKITTHEVNQVGARVCEHWSSCHEAGAILGAQGEWPGGAGTARPDCFL